MYAAPVVFPASLVLNKFGSGAFLAYGLYPLTGIIEGFRSMIAPDRPINWDLLGMSGVGALIIFLFGAFIFKKMESLFADVA
jgi:lipopolysaccharide transport system permease protein